MFETKKTLIVVYKDELLMNQLKKMVETHGDNDNDKLSDLPVPDFLKTMK